MIKYKEYDDYIEVLNTSNFNVKETLECGQVFRFKTTDFGYRVYSFNHKADIYCQNSGVKIFTKDKKSVGHFEGKTNLKNAKWAYHVRVECKNNIQWMSEADYKNAR